MSSMVAVLIVAAALAADVVVEIAAETSSLILLDNSAGTVVDVAPGPPTEVVDMAPAASLGRAP